MSALITENLPLLAGAPNGIKKLRELILELAVRGKLVAQDSNDEPASELLKQIAAEKVRLVGEGKLKGKAAEEVVAEVRYPIPATWAAVSLGEVVEIVRGITFPASEKSKTPELGRVACLRTSNVQSEIEWGDLLYIRETFVSRPNQYVQPHDIVMSMANSRELVGKVALIDAELKQKTTFGGFLGVLRPILIDPRFVMALLRTPVARNALIDSASQTTNIANISLAKLRPLPFAIPPFAEQHRIVAKVDELMALCDRLEAQQADAESAHAQLVAALLGSLTQARDADDFAASWQRLSAHFHTLFTTESSIDALKQALLQLAVMGKLVPQDPSDEPASELLKRIFVDRARLVAEGKFKPQKVSVGIGEEEEPFLLPEGWAWVRKAEVFSFLNGYAFKSEWFRADGVRLLRNINVSHGVTDWKDVACISAEQAVEFEGFQLAENDVVLTLDRPIISSGLKYAVIEKRDLPCLLLQRVARISPYAGSVSIRYLSTWLNSRFFIGSIDPGRSNGVPHISTNQVAGMIFALPPLAEQHRIVAKVDQLMALCDQLKSRLTRARQLNEQLASTLTERAVA